MANGEGPRLSDAEKLWAKNGERIGAEITEKVNKIIAACPDNCLTAFMDAFVKGLKLDVSMQVKT